jgi:hypothetical protein
MIAVPGVRSEVVGPGAGPAAGPAACHLPEIAAIPLYVRACAAAVLLNPPPLPRSS